MYILFHIYSNYKTIYIYINPKKGGLQWIWACVCWGNQVWQRNHGSSQLGPNLPAREAGASWLQGVQSQGQWCGNYFIHKSEECKKKYCSLCSLCWICTCFSSMQPHKDDHVLNVQFSWHGLVKPVASAFVGVSPEFEIAIFTILFLSSTEKTTTAVVNLDEYQLEMVVHRHGRSIGTAYPKLLSSNNRHV